MLFFKEWILELMEVLKQWYYSDSPKMYIYGLVCGLGQASLVVQW